MIMNVIMSLLQLMFVVAISLITIHVSQILLIVHVFRFGMCVARTHTHTHTGDTQDKKHTHKSSKTDTEEKEVEKHSKRTNYVHKSTVLKIHAKCTCEIFCAMHPKHCVKILLAKVNKQLVDTETHTETDTKTSNKTREKGTML